MKNIVDKKLETPINAKYLTPKKINSYSDFFLCCSTVLLAVNFSLRKLPILELPVDPAQLIYWIDVANCLIIILFAMCELAVIYTRLNAESYRNDLFIDYSFSTLFSIKKTPKYYSNENLPYGVYKMGVNNFESCFFSHSLASKSLFNSWIKTVIISLVFIFCAITGFNETVIFIIQLSIPFIVIQQTIKNTRFKLKLDHVLSKHRLFFNKLEGRIDLNMKEQGVLIRTVLEYEATMAWGEMLFSDKTYNKMNKTLSDEWEKYKESCLIPTQKS